MDEIIALEDRRIEAMTKGDVQALEEILADDLIYIHTTARIDTKSSFIEAISSGRSNYRSVEREDVKVRQFGDSAVSPATPSSTSAITNSKPGSLMYTPSGTAPGRWWRGSRPGCRIKHLAQPQDWVDPNRPGNVFRLAEGVRDRKRVV